MTAPSEPDPSISSRISLACAKRTATERRGIHAWHPYYAGYSEAFVESALSYLAVGTTSTLLDPWGGSGTTGIIASRNGFSCISSDVNPVMATFAGSKSPTILENKDKIRKFLSGFNFSATEPPNNFRASAIYDPETALMLSQFLSAVDAELPPLMKKVRICTISTTDQNARGGVLSPVNSFIKAALFIAIRRLMGHVRLTNPTWIRKEQPAISIDSNALLIQLKSIAEFMFNDLEDFYASSNSLGALHSTTGDARKLTLAANSVDHIITSPPYLTRIDYAVSTLPELDLIGGKNFVHQIRHETTGAPIITQGAKSEDPKWGTICLDLLRNIKNHGTQAAAGYYWKNITQYFMDIAASLLELKRVLRIGGDGLLVVQSSYFKDIEIPLGEIFVEMAENIGFSAKIVSRQVVRGHMAHKNKRSNVYKNNKTYFEDVVYIKNMPPKSNSGEML